MEEKLHQQMVIPEWVMAMIEAPFSIIKGKGKHEDDLKYFCVDCCGHTLTESQMKAMHHGHEVLRAYTCSYYYVYRTHDVHGLASRVLDVSGVAPFKINSGLVFYRKSPIPLDQYQNKFGVDGRCFTCGRGLKYPGFFCSILCKFLFCPPQHYSKNVIQILMSIFEQNQVYGGLLSHCKKKLKGSKKNQIKKYNDDKEEIEEVKRGLKRKHGVGDGICQTETNQVFVEENPGFGGSVTDCKKKKLKISDNKEGKIEAEERSKEVQERIPALRKRKQGCGDHRKKKMKMTDNKDGQIKVEQRRPLLLKLKLGASAGTGVSDGYGDVVKNTEANNDGEKLLETLISAVVTDREKLSPSHRRSRKGIPRRSPFY